MNCNSPSGKFAYGIIALHNSKTASQVALVVKNPSANAEDTRDTGSIPGSGRSPGVGNGNPLQYSFLEKSMGWGAWLATACGVTKSRTVSYWVNLIEIFKHLKWNNFALRLEIILALHFPHFPKTVKFISRDLGRLDFHPVIVIPKYY